MATPKRYRWVCEGGHKGVLAPGRMRKNDVRRFCWPCSEAAGVLVERICPALDAKRTTKAVQRKTKAAAARERARAKAKAADPHDLRGWYKRFQRLEAFRPPTRYWSWSDCNLTLRGGHQRSGTARGSYEIVLRGVQHPSRAWLVAALIHEMAHIIACGGGHGDRWRSIFAAAIHDLTGETLAWETHHRYSDNAESIIRRWLEENSNA